VSNGIDLAKNGLALHGVDAAGKPVLVHPNVARSALVELLARLPHAVNETTNIPKAHTVCCAMANCA
jgi:hypothetical protein